MQLADQCICFFSNIKYHVQVSLQGDLEMAKQVWNVNSYKERRISACRRVPRCYCQRGTDDESRWQVLRNKWVALVGVIQSW